MAVVIIRYHKTVFYYGVARFVSVFLLLHSRDIAFIVQNSSCFVDTGSMVLTYFIVIYYNKNIPIVTVFKHFFWVAKSVKNRCVLERNPCQ